MKPPFIFNDNGDVTVYRNIAAVNDYIEIIDVVNGAYTIYDYEGQRLHAIVQGRNISLQEDTKSLGKADELKNILETYLINVCILEPDTKDQSLQWLIEQMMYFLEV